MEEGQVVSPSVQGGYDSTGYSELWYKGKLYARGTRAWCIARLNTISTTWTSDDEVWDHSWKIKYYHIEY